MCPLAESPIPTWLTVNPVLFPGSNLLQVDHQLYQTLHTLPVPSDIHRPPVVCTHLLGLGYFGFLRMHLLHDINPDAVQPNIKCLATVEDGEKLCEYFRVVVQQRHLQYLDGLHHRFDGSAGHLHTQVTDASETSLDRSLWAGNHRLCSIDLTSYNPLFISIWYRCHIRLFVVNDMDNSGGRSGDHLRQLANVENAHPAFLPTPVPLSIRDQSTVEQKRITAMQIKPQ